MLLKITAVAAAALFCQLPALAEQPERVVVVGWQLTQQGELKPSDLFSSGDWVSYAVGDPLRPGSAGAWVRVKVTLPASIGSTPTSGKPVGLRLNSDAGGAIYLDGKLQSRFDNDHPGLALLTRSCKPGEVVEVALKPFPDLGDVNKEVRLGQADMVVLDAEVNQPLRVTLDASTKAGLLPRPFRGLSQGAGMADYSDATAARFREIGIRWFRMDNIFTNAVKRSENGTIEYDWTDFDKRLDFMAKIGCDFIACASYMPEALEAFPDKDRHARPASYEAWEELCYQAAKHAIDRGRRIPYWEIWNEANSGWLKPTAGEDALEAYLKLYDATWKGVRRADPEALIGGPCNASGPWDTSPERGYAVNGERYMRGLLEHCNKTGAPLDFISWHEYFHPPAIFREEAEVTRQYMKDYPKAAAGVREFMITEWNYAWWQDWPQDNEVGACWAANSILRAMIPAKIDKPCFFFAMDFGENDRGNWGMLRRSGAPKPVYNAAKLFSMMASEEIPNSVSDDQLAVQAAIDPDGKKLTVLVLNYAESYSVERRVWLSVSNVPAQLRGGQAIRWVVDKDHSNGFNDPEKPMLEEHSRYRIAGDGSYAGMLTLPANSLTLIELVPEH